MKRSKIVSVIIGFAMASRFTSTSEMRRKSSDMTCHLKCKVWESIRVPFVVFDPNYTPQNPQRTVFEFTERERNWTLVDRINDIIKLNEEFIPAAPPKDWKIEVTPIQSQDAAPPRVANPNQPANTNPIR